MLIPFLGKEFCGRTLKVEYATYFERTDKFGGGRGRDWGGGRGGGRGGRGGEGGFRDRGGFHGGDGGYRGGRGRGRGGGQPNFAAGEGDWTCPDPK